MHAPEHTAEDRAGSEPYLPAGQADLFPLMQYDPSGHMAKVMRCKGEADSGSV